MKLLRFLRKLIKDDGFELVDANNKLYLIGKPKKENPIKFADKKEFHLFHHAGVFTGSTSRPYLSAHVSDTSSSHFALCGQMLRATVVSMELPS